MLPLSTWYFFYARWNILCLRISPEKYETQPWTLMGIIAYYSKPKLVEQYTELQVAENKQV